MNNFYKKFHIPSIILIALSVLTNLIMIIPSIGRREMFDFFIIIFVSLMVTLFGVFSIEKAMDFLDKPVKKISRLDNFYFDFYVVNYFFILFIFILILFNQSNIDMKGWWIVFEFILALVSPVYAFIYAIFGTLLNRHRMYTIFFSFLFFGSFLISMIFPRFMFSWILPIAAHLIYCVSYKLTT